MYYFRLIENQEPTADVLPRVSLQSSRAPSLPSVSTLSRAEHYNALTLTLFLVSKHPFNECIVFNYV